MQRAAIGAALLVWSLGFELARANDKIEWQPDLNAARAAAAQSGRLVLVHFWAPWCEPCLRLEHDVLAQPGLGTAIAPQFVAVKINRDREPVLAQQLGVTSLPCDIVMSADGRILGRANGGVPTVQEYFTRIMKLANPAVAGTTPGSAASPPSAVSNAPATGVPAAGPPDQISAAPAPAYGGRAASQAWEAQPAGQALAEGTANDPIAPSVAPPAEMPVGQGAPPQAMAGPAVDPAAFDPPLGLEGFCPVELYDQYRWTPGDVRYGAIFEGRTYLFAGPDEQRWFLENPARYSPVQGGLDTVAAIDQGQQLSGRREFGVVCGGRVFLFASRESLERFERDPERYATVVFQASRTAGPAGGTLQR